MREQTFREQEQSGKHQEGEAARIVGTHGDADPAATDMTPAQAPATQPENSQKLS